MLKDAWLILTLSIDFHLVADRVILVWHQSDGPFITVVVDDGVLPSDTSSTELDSRRESGCLLTDEVIAIVEGELKHTRQSWVLIDVPKLWSSLKSALLKLCVLELSLLCLQPCLELSLLALDFSHGFSLLLKLGFKLSAVAIAATTATG